MSEGINVTEVRTNLVRMLRSLGFTQSAADPTDFQQNTDRSLRFKIGTAYKEVTITTWNYSRQVGTNRITQPHHVEEVGRMIRDRIDEKAERQRVSIQVYDR